MNNENRDRILKQIGQWFEKENGKEEGREKFRQWYIENNSEFSTTVDNASKRSKSVNAFTNVSGGSELSQRRDNLSNEKIKCPNFGHLESSENARKGKVVKKDYGENLKQQLNNLKQSKLF